MRRAAAGIRDGNPRRARRPAARPAHRHDIRAWPQRDVGLLQRPQDIGGALDADGWLNTGDIGYSVEGSLVITGRQKDLIIINGRNIWPQDLEYLAEHQDETRVGDALAFSVPGRRTARSACWWCNAARRMPTGAPR